MKMLNEAIAGLAVCRHFTFSVLRNDDRRTRLLRSVGFRF